MSQREEYPFKKLWETKYQNLYPKVEPVDLDTLSGDDENAVRIVVLSDTHSVHREMVHDIPDGDILVHAGDFTQRGTVSQVRDFLDWFSAFPHPFKILVAGNHDISFDPKAVRMGRFQEEIEHPDLDGVKSFIPENCIYLENERCEVMGLRFYGSPDVRQHGSPGQAFSFERSELKALREAIPDDIDVLITHSPPLGVLDLCHHGDFSGCEDLLVQVNERIKPKLHIFGHIHESYGAVSNGTTTFVNGAICIKTDPKEGKKAIRKPIVFDYVKK